MDQIIQAAYSGLIVTALMVVILGATIIHNLHSKKNYGSTFWIAVSVAVFWLGELVLRTWWTVWRDHRIEREASSWMINHPLPLIACLFMVSGGILFIKTMTEDANNGRLWKICAGVVLCVSGLIYLIG